MRSWIAAAIVAAALLAFGPVLVDPAAAAPKRQIDGASHATDFSAHRHHRRYHRHHGRYRPNYQPCILPAISLSDAGAVHLRHRVRSILVVTKDSCAAFLHSSLRPAHS